MSISQSRMEDWRCARCGEVTSRLTWLAVDAVERPDLIAGFSDLIEFECSNCRRPLRRSQPLLVLRLAKAAPLIAARAADDQRDPLESLGGIVTAVQGELGDTLDEVPGPPAVVTFAEVEAGVRGNIDADVEASQADANGDVDHEPTYRKLLSEIAVTQRRQKVDTGLKELALVGSEEQLREVVDRWPEVASEEAEYRVAEHLDRATTADRRQFAISMLDTVQLCRKGDFAGAWSVREAVIRRFQEETVSPRLQAFREAERGVTRIPLAQAAMDLLDVLPQGVEPELQAEVAAKAVVALLEDEGSNREENIELAIELGRLVISILDTYPEIDHLGRRVPVLMNLSMAFGIRPRGDPAWNRAQSLTLLTDAIEPAWQADDRDSWAMALTNLANLLLDRGEPGDTDQALEHLELALSHRSFRRNPRDWAFIQIELGRAHARTERGDRSVNMRRAIRHSAKARYAARTAGDMQLLAFAEHNLAAQQYQLSQVTGTAHADQSRLLDRAEASGLESARLSPVDQSPLRFGHAWTIVGKIRSAREIGSALSRPLRRR